MTTNFNTVASYNSVKKQTRKVRPDALKWFILRIKIESLTGLGWTVGPYMKYLYFLKILNKFLFFSPQYSSVLIILWSQYSYFKVKLKGSLALEGKNYWKRCLESHLKFSSKKKKVCVCVRERAVLFLLKTKKSKK